MKIGLHSASLILVFLHSILDVYDCQLVPENSPECGLSVFFTHRQSRFDDPSPVSGRSSRIKLFNNEEIRNNVSNNISRNSRRRRLNYRMMTWKDYNLNDEPAAASSYGRIVNGEDSKPGSWPWQVLTAAHCLKNRLFRLGQGTSWFVLAGEYNRVKTEGTEKIIGVSQIFVHERFKEFDNDIALIKLSRPLTWSPTVAPICLPNDDEKTLTFNMTGLKCVSTGWGMNSPRGKLSSKMQQVWVDVVSQEKCDELYQKAYQIGIRNFHLCAGPIDNKTSKGTCVGDSGGPLQCNFLDGRWSLIGITSFGSGCGKPGYPDVYSRITYYLPWIRGKIRAHS